jgi:hypothetical protein
VTETQDRPFGQRLKRGFETTILVPAATAIVRAAASYLIKRLPMILEEKVLPKLLEKDAAKPVVNALEQAATTLAGSPGSTNGRGSDGEPSDEGDPSFETAASEHAPTADAKSMSNDQREEERRKRAQRRRQRKSASAKAA